MIRIITDSTAEFTREEAEKYGIDVVPLTVTIKGKSYLDRIDLMPGEFYKLLVDDFARTSQPSPAKFEEVFRKYEGDDIICLLLSSKLSGTYSSAKVGAEGAERNDIEIIDTGEAVNSLKNIILEAIRMRDEGKSKNEIVNEIKNLLGKVRCLIALGTTDYLVKGGRLSKIAGATSKLIQLKPILVFKDGALVPEKVVRGMKKSLQFIADTLSEADIDNDKHILLSYSSDPSNALTLQKILEERGIKTEELTEFGPVVGTYAGFNAVVVSYFER